MSIIPPNHTPSTTPENAPLAPNFEDQVREFWIKYSRFVYLLVVIALLAVLGKGGYEIYREKQEQSVAADYNRAATNDQLRAFANANGTHTLAGVAFLRLGDDAYSNNKYGEAAANYAKAAPILKEGALAARAYIGEALCRVLDGKVSEGEARLQAIAGDTTQLKALRAEATYHLGAIASDAGRTEDANKFFDQAASIDPTSSWAQRALLRKK